MPSGSERLSLRGERVLVTGAASGIGLAVVRRCLADGAAVGALDRDGERLRAAVADLRNHSRRSRVATATADVSDPKQVASAVNELGERFGDLSAVVNVAGIGGYTGDVAETSFEAWQTVLTINLTGVFLVSREALPFLRKGNGGSIVNVSSSYGLVGCLGSPAYVASKAGVIGLTRAMAVDHAKEHIRVNCVCPGPTDTPMLHADQESKLSASEERRTEHRRLLDGVGTAAGIADAIAYLIGPGAADTTGAVLSVDGGWTAS